MSQSDSRMSPVDQLTDMLDNEVAALDGATLSALGRARQAAVAQGARRPSLVPWLIPAAGLATTAFAALLLVGSGAFFDPAAIERRSPPAAVAVVATAVATESLVEPDFELLADPDVMAVAEDLEFYAWLANGNG